MTGYRFHWSDHVVRRGLGGEGDAVTKDEVGVPINDKMTSLEANARLLSEVLMLTGGYHNKYE